MAGTRTPNPDPEATVAEDADFKVGVDPDCGPEVDTAGSAYFTTKRRGRARPRHEVDALLVLAAAGRGPREVARDWATGSPQGNPVVRLFTPTRSLPRAGR